jgi:hypothetical protein
MEQRSHWLIVDIGENYGSWIGLFLQSRAEIYSPSAHTRSAMAQALRDRDER